MTQLALQFDTPRSRRSDPASSRLAGQALEANGVLSAQRREVLEALRRFPDSTSAELADRAGLCRFKVARRLPELEVLGCARRGPIRKCEFGRPAVCWFATP